MSPRMKIPEKPLHPHMGSGSRIYGVVVVVETSDFGPPPTCHFVPVT